MSSPLRLGGSPGELTPRSRVKAMLAALDDDQSDEQSPPRRAPEQGAHHPSVDTTRDPENMKLHDGLNLQDHNGSGSDTDDGPLVPRGRLAARLMANSTHVEGAGSDGQEIHDPNAYERVKRKLLKTHIPNPQEEQLNHSKDGELAQAEVEESTPPPEAQSGLSKNLRTPQTSRALKDSSPGLFVTPDNHDRSSHSVLAEREDEEDDSDMPEASQENSRFLQLVAKKRAEREAREAEEERKKREKLAKRREFERALSVDASACSDSSDEGRRAEQRLTQAARPTRKASKKALEEMTRETQRMNRNMQLAHQAKTKRKISKDSLFQRFNFRLETAVAKPVEAKETSSTANSQPTSDAEEIFNQVSPPTSPLQTSDHDDKPSHPYHGGKSLTTTSNGGITSEDVDQELPTMEDIFSGSLIEKQERPEQTERKELGSANLDQNHVRSLQLPPRFRLSESTSNNINDLIDLDSASDQEDKSGRGKRQRYRSRAKLERFQGANTNKVKDGSSLLKLRALAHLQSPNGQSRSKRASINPHDMQISLQKRARQQAQEERSAKIEQLKAKGIFISTTEERQKDQVQIEDLLAKARRENEELKQKEKRAKKAKKLANGDEQADESSTDEEYQDEIADGEEVELSGSEDEDQDSDGSNLTCEGDEEEEDQEQPKANAGSGLQALMEDQADEGSEEEGQDNDGDEDTDEEVEQRVMRSKRRLKRVVADDDEENDGPKVDSRAATDHQLVSSLGQKPVDTIMAGPFGGPFENQEHQNQSFGLTQAFAATMANTQGSGDPNVESQTDMPDAPPEPFIPIVSANDLQHLTPTSQADPRSQAVANLHDVVEPTLIEVHSSQPELIRANVDLLVSPQNLPENTQLSQIPDPTQDAGFLASSPAPERFVASPPSTVGTVLLSAPLVARSPPKRKGRLHRRQVATADTDEEVISTAQQADSEVDAFDFMKEQRAKASAKATFDKKKSEAKEMIEEQAQESEDEYAGLGGASDDDSGGEADEDLVKMMDHGDVNVEERALAALHADTERAKDEKAIEKLYRDINNGGLRRKRGADLDLSDSDDDADARRRQKQREFARMRKALLADENVGKIAEDPKKMAFLRAIEDREMDDEDADFLDQPANESFLVETSMQDDSQQQRAPEPINIASNQHPSYPEGIQPLQETDPNKRPPANARRTKVAKKPSTLAEVRESVSFLVEAPGAEPQGLDASSSASEDEESSDRNQNLDQEQQEDQGNRHPRRTRGVKTLIIDRLSLKRASSTSSNSSHASAAATSAAPFSRLAFYAPTTTASNASGSTTDNGFKVPSLLRRATTQLTAITHTDAGTNTGVTYGVTERTTNGANRDSAAAAGVAIVKRGGGGSGGSNGGKRCSINYHAGNLESKRARDGIEKRRQQARERQAREGRKGAGRLGSLMGGRFDG